MLKTSCLKHEIVRNLSLSSTFSFKKITDSTKVIIILI